MHKMFDWDTHYDEVVADATEGKTDAAGDPAPERASWAQRARAFAGRWAMAAAVAVGMSAAGTGALLVPRDAPERWMAQASAWSTTLLGAVGLDDSALPEGLLAYDQAQYDRFRRGIARFSDDELLDYARTTQRDLNGSNVMAAYTHDALFLTQREIERRGLNRPVASLRDAFERS
jgi:hypothetical protein